MTRKTKQKTTTKEIRDGRHRGGWGAGSNGGVPVRKVVVSEFVSGDGVVDDPGWTFQFGSEEQEKFKFAERAESDALLLDRVTYEGFAAARPNMNNHYEGPRRPEHQEYADMMNG